MLANLNRQKFIDLLNKLGDSDDDEVIAAARDLHAQVVVSGLTWDDLLFPEEEEEEALAEGEGEEAETGETPTDESEEASSDDSGGKSDE